MGSTLTTDDISLIEEYKKYGVLDDIAGHLLCPQSGLTLVMCGDPDQHPDAYDYKVREITNAGFKGRIHPPAPLGGALRLVHDSPTNIETPGYDRGLMWDIKTVYEKKGVTTTALYVHAPCAVANMCGMNFQDIIAQAFAAKCRIKAEIPEMRVAVFCHIDYGNGRKKTKFVCRKKWALYHTPMGRLALQYPDRVSIVPNLSVPQAQMPRYA
jgi:hypothetical protein